MAAAHRAAVRERVDLTHCPCSYPPEAGSFGECKSRSDAWAGADAELYPFVYIKIGQVGQFPSTRRSRSERDAVSVRLSTIDAGSVGNMTARGPDPRAAAGLNHPFPSCRTCIPARFSIAARHRARARDSGRRSLHADGFRCGRDRHDGAGQASTLIAEMKRISLKKISRTRSGLMDVVARTGVGDRGRRQHDRVFLENSCQATDMRRALARRIHPARKSSISALARIPPQALWKSSDSRPHLGFLHHHHLVGDDVAPGLQTRRCRGPRPRCP